MNYTDYVNWAEEYRREIEVLTKKLQERKKPIYFKDIKEKQIYERTTYILNAMRKNCLEALREIELTKNRIIQKEEKDGTNTKLIKGT